MGEDGDDERDPFGRFEDAVDREGDPFEHLASPDVDEGVRGGDATDRGDDGDGANEGSTSNEAGSEDAAMGADKGSLGTSRRHGEVDPDPPPIDASDRATRSDDPFSSPDSTFQRMDAGDVDEDEVWEALADAQARGSVADASERTYAEVSKHSFCEGCEHFTGPPDVACTHDGTEILEFIDVETVRVVDCPIVAERRALQRGENTDP